MVQITSGGAATHGADCLPATLTAGFCVNSHTSNSEIAGGWRCGWRGEPAVIKGLVALEDADTGDPLVPHRFARCRDCAYFLANVLK